LLASVQITSYNSHSASFGPSAVRVNTETVYSGRCEAGLVMTSIESNATVEAAAFALDESPQNSVAGHSLHYGLNAPPPASQASVPRVASEDKSCFNAGSVGERTSARSYST
jgi:hypothetical protein